MNRAPVRKYFVQRLRLEDGALDRALVDVSHHGALDLSVLEHGVSLHLFSSFKFPSAMLLVLLAQFNPDRIARGSYFNSFSAYFNSYFNRISLPKTQWVSNTGLHGCNKYTNIHVVLYNLDPSPTSARASHMTTVPLRPPFSCHASFSGSETARPWPPRVFSYAIPSAGTLLPSWLSLFFQV